MLEVESASPLLKDLLERGLGTLWMQTTWQDVPNVLEAELVEGDALWCKYVAGSPPKS